MPSISPFLWYNDQAEEAANLYTSIFKNSSIGRVRRWGPGAPAPEGSVMSVTFTIEGREFQAFNGGPHYTFSPAISLFVNCETQEEVDAIWDKLADGGTPQQCGWITDRFGVTWQIIPNALGEMLQDKDPEKARRVVQAMMQMVKIDVPTLQRAYDGEEVAADS